MEFVQQVLPFEFWDEEKADLEKTKQNLPKFQNPKNDNEILINMQFDFYNGKTRIDDIFLKLIEVAGKLLNWECGKKKLRFTKSRKQEIALDTAALVIEQIEKNNLMIKKSYTAYLYLQLRKVLYGRTLAEMFEGWCVKNRINIFEKNTLEAEILKAKFEKELETRGKKLAKLKKSDRTGSGEMFQCQPWLF